MIYPDILLVTETNSSSNSWQFLWERAVIFKISSSWYRIFVTFPFDQKVQAQEQLGWREKERAVKIFKFPALRPRRWWGLGVHLFLDLYDMGCHCRPAPAFYGKNNPTLIIEIFLLFIPEHMMIFFWRLSKWGNRELESKTKKSILFDTFTLLKHCFVGASKKPKIRTAFLAMARKKVGL